jgi:hypothetical protein
VKQSPKITCYLKALAYTSIPESESDTDDDTGGGGGLPEEILQVMAIPKAEFPRIRPGQHSSSSRKFVPGFSSTA